MPMMLPSKMCLRVKLSFYVEVRWESPEKSKMICRACA
jgi:hypothetical protein